MRNPKPYTVERKSRRRTAPDSAPASIWGNLDLGAALNNAGERADAPRPAAKTTPVAKPASPERQRKTLSLQSKPKP